MIIRQANEKEATMLPFSLFENYYSSSFAIIIATVFKMVLITATSTERI
jgi:hypothetical protein